MTEWTVSAAEGGNRLVNYLREKLQGKYAARTIKRALESNHCEVNGAIERFASRELKVGDRVRFQMPEAKGLVMPSWEKLYIDDDILVANKPAGVVVDSADTLKALIKEFGPVTLVHRLDRDTTGILLLARNAEAAAGLEKQFREHEVEKSYLAVVDGVLLEPRGEVINRLGKIHSYDGQSIWGEVPRGQGREAHTLWRLVASGDRACLVHCQPKTGRTHQLRVHLKSLGHPILGDYQYARRFSCGYRPLRCLLHASEISFLQPCKGQRIHVRAAIPQDFSQALQALKIPFSAAKRLKKIPKA